MTIECYYSDCRYHSDYFQTGDGPFCDEEDCRATEEEIKEFEEKRYGKKKEHLKDKV